MSKTNKQKRWPRVLICLLILIGGAFLIHHQIEHNQQFQSIKTSVENKNQPSQKERTTNDSQLASLNYQPGGNPVVVVNNNRSTLNPSSWQSDHVEFGNLDILNRTSNITTAYLNRSNATNASLRTRQFVSPTGWHSNHLGKQIYNRGHLIAYSISKGINNNGQYQSTDNKGNENNLKNLFTQTAFSNQKLQTVYEKQVRDALYQNKEVIYQVQPIFRGSELMARGIHLQAISTDGSLNFNVYIYNVQPGYKFNYSTGKAIKDNSMKILQQ